MKKNQKKNQVNISDHYFSEYQSSKPKETQFSDKLRGNILEFKTASGVFSLKKIDNGSRLLIEKSIIKNNSKILDLGCGYGAVGIAIAKAYLTNQVILTDINKRAVSLAKKNIELNNIENAKAVQGNMFEKIDEKFDTILLNPPQTAGKKLCFEMIEKSKDYLNPKGTFQIVARHQKGGKILSQHMKEIFGNLEEIAKGSGFRIYLSHLE